MRAYPKRPSPLACIAGTIVGIYLVSSVTVAFWVSRKARRGK